MCATAKFICAAQAGDECVANLDSRAISEDYVSSDCPILVQITAHVRWG